MTTDLMKHSSYRRYLELGKTALSLPDFETNSDGCCVLLVGEAYCRVPGCSSLTKFTTNNLRKHVSAHRDVTAERGRSGHATREQVDKALRFYREVIASYDEQMLLKATVCVPVHPLARPKDSELVGSAGRTGKPMLPLRKDGKGHNVTETRRLAREMGYKVPCESCALDRNRCCKDLERCPLGQLFTAKTDNEGEHMLLS